jgi:hypothetical protein
MTIISDKIQSIPLPVCQWVRVLLALFHVPDMQRYGVMREIAQIFEIVLSCILATAAFT